MGPPADDGRNLKKESNSLLQPPTLPSRNIRIVLEGWQINIPLLPYTTFRQDGGPDDVLLILTSKR